MGVGLKLLRSNVYLSMYIATVLSLVSAISLCTGAHQYVYSYPGASSYASSQQASDLASSQQASDLTSSASNHVDSSSVSNHSVSSSYASFPVASYTGATSHASSPVASYTGAASHASSPVSSYTGVSSHASSPVASYPTYSPSAVPQISLFKTRNNQNAEERTAPIAEAALAYLREVEGQDICAQSAKAYLEAIHGGGTTVEAKSAASNVYIDNLNSGLTATPGSACEAAGIAFQNAEASGKNPVLPAAIAFMEKSTDLKDGNPCAVAGRDYITSFIDGATATEATYRAAKSFAGAFKKLGDTKKELKDPACLAAMKAFEKVFSAKTSSPLVAAMNSFVEKAFDGFSAEYDPLCWKSTEAFFDSYAVGNTESQSTSKAAKVFIEEVANGEVSIPAKSPCASATRAYIDNANNPSSHAVKAAMEAFIDRLTAKGGIKADPACSKAAVSYLDAFEAGATESNARLAAAEGFLRAFASGLHIRANSPCLVASKAYFDNIDTKFSPSIAVAMNAFLDAMVAKGNKRVYDPACADATMAYLRAIKKGDYEQTARSKAGLAFINTYKRENVLPAESPCVEAATAYSKASSNLPDSIVNDAMLAYIDEAVLSNTNAVDPVCLASAEAYFKAYSIGASDFAAKEAAGIAYLDAVARSPSFNPRSPCGVAANTYMARFTYY